MIFLKKISPIYRILCLTAACTGGQILSGCGQEFSEETLQSPLNIENIENEARSSVNQPFIPFQGYAKSLEKSAPVTLTRVFFNQLEGLKVTDLAGKLLKTKSKVTNTHELLQFIGPGFHWDISKQASSPSSQISAPFTMFDDDSLLSGNTSEYGTITERLTLMYEGVPVASTSAISQESANTDTWIAASLPDWAGKALIAGVQPQFSVSPFSISADSASNLYSLATGFDTEYLSQAEKHYIVNGNELRAAYRYTVSSNPNDSAISRSPAAPLVTFVDADNGTILEQYPLAFHVNGSARLYRENSKASSQEGIVELVLPDLIGTGENLSHALYSVENCNQNPVGSKCGFRAIPSSGANYTMVTSDNDSYDELVAYYALSRAMTWYRNLMGATNGPYELENSWKSNRSDFGLASSEIGKLTVYVRALSRTPTNGYTPDNAVYLPGGSSGVSTPEIVIGTGWEASMNSPPRSLRYIGKDADVSMHEFGHHIVFRSISEIKGQGLAMHEGFADYFTYAITGNNLLAESVVSSGNSLRSATKRGTLSDYPPATTPPHTAGEFWSTVLWDVREYLGNWKDGFKKFDKIAYHAIDLMQPSENYYGAIAALARSAEIFAVESGDDPVQLKERMFAHFYKRGFLNEPTGDGIVPPPSMLLSSATSSPGLSNSAQPSASTTPEEKKPKAASLLGMSCSIGATQAATSRDSRNDVGTLLLLLLIGGLPLSSIFRQNRPKKVKVRTKHR